MAARDHDAPHVAQAPNVTATLVSPELAEKAREALARRDFSAFCAWTDPRYIRTRHTKAICEHLQALADGHIRKLMLFIPPRHGKTYHASERFPAYFEGVRGGRADVILASYTIDRARASSRKARHIMREPSWPFLDVRLDPESQAVDEWRTQGGGVVKAAGVGGSMTGFGAHLLAIDDPIKGRASADSPKLREAQWSWYLEVARTRLERDARELLATTRWHSDDIAGRILNTPAAKDWTVLRLPAIAEADDPLGRAIGEELAPELGLTLPRVERGEISSRGFAALYQGSPQIDSGKVFRREWFRYYDVAGASLTLRSAVGLPAVTYPISACIVFQIVDLATSLESSADFTVIGTFALTPRLDLLVLDIARERIEGPRQLAFLQALYAKWRSGRIGIEAVQYQMAFVQAAVAAGLPAVPIKRGHESKETRAWTIAARYEAGKVFHPRFAPWLQDLEAELLAFPVGEHDDQVDVLSDAGAVVAEREVKANPHGAFVA